VVYWLTHRLRWLYFYIVVYTQQDAEHASEAGGKIAAAAFTFVSCWTLLRPWRWRRYDPPKRRFTLNGLHGHLLSCWVLAPEDGGDMFLRNVGSSTDYTGTFHAGFVLNLFFWLWRWRRYVIPKRRLTLNGLDGVISQKTVLSKWDNYVWRPGGDEVCSPWKILFQNFICKTEGSKENLMIFVVFVSLARLASFRADIRKSDILNTVQA
jgi:hypothetical protein